MPEIAARIVAAVDARVVANSRICSAHVRIEAAIPDFPTSQPGQFLALRCTDAVETFARPVDWPADGFPSLAHTGSRERTPFLRRPFSIADHWIGSNGCAHLSVISRAIGPGTRWLERLRPGDTLNLTGPLGRGFRIPERPTPMALVGGGVGIPPLLYLARRLHELGHTDVTVIFGARTREILPVRLVSEPAADGEPRTCAMLPAGAPFPAIITTDDGSAGLRGTAANGARVWYERAAPAGAPLVFACGPEPLLRAVASLTRARACGCQLCIERHMGCGLGTCLSCIVRIRDGAQEAGWRWGLACTEGPVFERDELFDY